MLTITPVVLSNNKRRDGSYNVKIRVTWKGRSRYIATNLFCSKSDLTKSLRIKSPAVIDAAASLVRARLAKTTPEVFKEIDQMILYGTFLHISHRRVGKQRNQILYNKSYKGRRV